MRQVGVLNFDKIRQGKKVIKSIPFKIEKSEDYTPGDISYFRSICRKPSVTMIYQEGSIDPQKLLKFGLALEEEGLAVIRIYLYHNCQEDPVEISNCHPDKISLSQNCPNCDKKYSSNLETDVELIIKFPILIKYKRKTISQEFQI